MPMRSPRLTTPLVRDGGELRPASWDEALDRAAAGFRKALDDGAQLMVVDPRRTPSAQWADLWLGLDVGTDIPLANAVGREIIEAGLADMEFVSRATTDFDEYRESVEPWTLEEAERVTGVPGDAIRELAHAW